MLEREYKSASDLSILDVEFETDNASFGAYHVAYGVGTKTVAFYIVKDFWKGLHSAVRRVHENKISALQIFDCAFVYQIGVLIAPVYCVARPHYDFEAKFFACFEHCVAEASARRCE